MTPEQFTYWLQGFIEVENPKTLNLRQTKIIKDHLDLVFKKETPNRNKKLSDIKFNKTTGLLEFKDRKIC